MVKRPPSILPVLSATTAAQALVSFAMLAPAAIAPKIAQTLGVAPGLIGLWISLAYGAAMLTSLLGGGTVRRLGAARTTQMALLLSAAGTVCTAVGWLVPVVAGAALVGLGYGLTNPAASHLLARRASAGNRNMVFSIKQTGVPLGGMLAGLVTAPVAVAVNWHAAIALAAVFELALAALLIPARRHWDGDRDHKARIALASLGGLAEIWRQPGLRALSLCGFAYAAVQLSLSTFLVTMLVTELKWPLVQAGLVLSAAQVAGLVGRLAYGVIADRWAGGLMTLVGIGIATAFFALLTGAMSTAWPPLAVQGVLVLFAAAALGWNGVYLAELAHLAPADQIGRVTGASLFFTYGGVLVGPPLFAAAQVWLGSFTLAYGLFFLPAAAGAALLLLDRARTRARAA